MRVDLPVITPIRLLRHCRSCHHSVAEPGPRITAALKVFALKTLKAFPTSCGSPEIGL